MTISNLAPPETNFIVTKTKQSRIAQVDFSNIPFGRIFSDHMFVMDYQNGQWQQGQIMPYGNLSLSPATSALHYGQAIFEGLKANRDSYSDDILLFRPYNNAKRMNNSALRMGMPQLPDEIFVNAIKGLINLDRNWVPQASDASLYIRPVMFGCDSFIGVRSSENYKFVILTSPVGPYYTKPVKVIIADSFVRAFEGGTGEAKAAGNYGATMYPAMLAKQKGYDQVLWTDGVEHKYVEEIGTMNVFFIINGEVITPAFDGTILHGITRDSVLSLCSEMGLRVSERKISTDELFEAHAKGTLQDAFGAGTAATITHIEELAYKGKSYQLPPPETRTISIKVKKELENIKRGLTEDRFNWIVRV